MEVVCCTTALSGLLREQVGEAFGTKAHVSFQKHAEVANDECAHDCSDGVSLGIVRVMVVGYQSRKSRIFS